MHYLDSLSLARQKRAEQLSHVLYAISWRGGGEVETVRLYSLCTRFKLKLQSIRVYLSKGHGSFTLQRNNPITGEPDIVTITRIEPTPAPKPKRGRPSKSLLNETDPRLGTEFASPARVMPKDQNRDTDEKPDKPDTHNLKRTNRAGKGLKRRTKRQ